MEALGVPGMSDSPSCIPMVVIRKTDDGVKICGDLRGSNVVTHVDEEPVIDQLKIFRMLSNSEVLSKPDLAKGFSQIPLHPESRDITYFGIPEGLYRFRVFSFGPHEFFSCLPT